MKIFINSDNSKKLAVQTEDKLRKTCEKLNIDIVDKPEMADLICSIGGDGTFLQSCRLSYGNPTIGINCGTLGFLTDVNPDDIDKAMCDILAGKYYIEERMMLEGEVLKSNGDVVVIPPALNDIAVSKNTFGVVRFDTIVDDKLINSYTADGLIICTPTGSTAYNLSCGGPIVDPTANIITVTPIAPHTILDRSIVLSDESVVEIKITELRENTSCYVLYDGRPVEIETGDIVRIKKSGKIIKIVKLNWQSFIENIRRKIN